MNVFETSLKPRFFRVQILWVLVGCALMACGKIKPEVKMEQEHQGDTPHEDPEHDEPSGKHGGHGDVGKPTIERIQTELVNRYCISCHNIERFESKIDLSAIQTLISETPSGDPKARPLIVRGNPQSSALYTVIQQGLMPPYSQNDPVPREFVPLLEKWIQSLGTKADGDIAEPQNEHEHDQ